MFPLKDNIPACRFPLVNLVLICVNVVCFVYELGLGTGLDGFIRLYGFVPARFVAAQAENVLDLPRFMPIFSSMFIHGGLLHLLSNMWMLWLFGDNVEDSMGHRRYLFFYLLCGTVSVFAQTMANPASPIPLVGASGAISGVLGAYFLLYPRARILTLIPLFVFFYLIELPAFVFLGLWMLLQVMQGYAQQVAVNGDVIGGVAWWAHVGGFAAGAVLIRFFKEKQPGKRSKKLQLW